MIKTLIAPNPSPLTGAGTNTFLVGTGDVAVIDPGPDIESHRAAIVSAAGGRISHIFVTHAHVDHSAGAGALARVTNAPVLAFGGADAGRSPVMQRLADVAGGGEGRDVPFQPDIYLRDNDVVQIPGWSLRAIHTPGHMGGHLSFLCDNTLFCGDIILGWSTSLISPPDGDLLDYFRSLDRIEALKADRLLPAHGNPVADPGARIAALRAHRQARTSQILRALRDKPATAAELAQALYDIPPALMPAATRNVMAHLIALSELGVVRCCGAVLEAASFEVA